jgi:hypothetical protein
MNKKRFIWLLPVLLMALAISGCSDSNDGGSSGIGVDLKLTDELVYNADGTVYMGVDRPLTVMGGTGLIRGGKMNFDIGVPNSLKPLVTLLVEMDARLGSHIFSYAGYEGNIRAMDLAFTNLTKKMDITSAASRTMQEIYYIYVDGDCTVTAKDIPSTTIDGDIPIKVSNFSLPLKRGWNAVTKIIAATATGGTLIIGLADSKDLKNCNWVLE